MSPKLRRVTGKELIKALRKAGFEVKRQRGSHVHMKREQDGKRLTVPVHAGQVIPIGTLRAILRDAGITSKEFEKLLE
ncbi:MAG TPA: type II toxin-antitoxin system HicA family toxin [Anaerolineae bacterium]|nr:type II toxin-antitoxin system HicA family toxin [Anaerolineae bacterium]